MFLDPIRVVFIAVNKRVKGKMQGKMQGKMLQGINIALYYIRTLQSINNSSLFNN